MEEYVYEMLTFERKDRFNEENTITYITSDLRQYVKRSRMTIGKASTVEQLLKELRWIERLDAIAISRPEASSSAYTKIL